MFLLAILKLRITNLKSFILLLVTYEDNKMNTSYDSFMIRIPITHICFSHSTIILKLRISGLQTVREFRIKICKFVSLRVLLFS